MIDDKLTIFLDYDDVIVDWAGPAAALSGVDINEPDVREQFENNWGGIDKYIDEAEMWRRIHEIGASWWEDLPLLPWGRELYDWATAVGEVCFLTAPSDHPSCAAGKVNSIKKHFNTRNFLIGKPKYLCAAMNRVLMDDRPSNCDKFYDAGGHAFLFPNATKLKRTGEFQKVLEAMEWTIDKVRVSIADANRGLDQWRVYCRIETVDEVPNKSV